MKTLLIIAASNGKNLELAKNLADLARTEGLEPEVIDLVALDLVLYSTESEKRGVPEAACELALKLEKSDAMIFVAPEYNGLVPPTLNNMVAWVSRTSKHWRDAFNGKKAALATYSGGGGAYVLLAMRQQFSYLGVNILGRQILTNYSKPLNTDSALEVLRMLKA